MNPTDVHENKIQHMLENLETEFHLEVQNKDRK